MNNYYQRILHNLEHGMARYPLWISNAKLREKSFELFQRLRAKNYKNEECQTSLGSTRTEWSTAY